MQNQPQQKIGSLNSWKEISLYLNRGVRTVQRWERELGLPVHRIGRGPRSPVHAFPGELQKWLLRAGHERHEIVSQNGDGRPPTDLDGSTGESRVLADRSSILMRETIESMQAQRRRTEKLLETIENLRRRMRLHIEDQKANLKAVRGQLKIVKHSVRQRTSTHFKKGRVD